MVGFVFVTWSGVVASRTSEDDVGFGHGFAGFGDADGFGFVGGVAKACGVNEFDGDAFEGDVFGDEVAGGAGGGGDDGAVAFDEAVEKGGFAGVGAAYDGEGEAVADDAAVGKRFVLGRLAGFGWLRSGR